MEVPIRGWDFNIKRAGSVLCRVTNRRSKLLSDNRHSVYDQHAGITCQSSEPLRSNSYGSLHYDDAKDIVTIHFGLLLNRADELVARKDSGIVGTFRPIRTDFSEMAYDGDRGNRHDESIQRHCAHPSV